MYELKVLFNLVNFELIVAIADGAVGMLVIVIATGLERIIEEIIPIELLVIFLYVILKKYGFLFCDAKF